MLLPDNIHPENSIYYNGAIVLQVLQKTNGLDIVNLYQEVKQLKELTFSVFILCLDWLYIANIAKVKEGRVELCS
ncbi:ABC-three component system middle component 6 [Saccharicrinis sp. 156]|uniref:ABC-three component system middle component 6 n=1 Tax=Saccharicrinis sp. 156 TaxID=3417574 RepID=UPI003D3399CF